MTNKVRSIVATAVQFVPFIGWSAALIMMLAFKDNTKKTLVACAQVLCISIIVVGFRIVRLILSLILGAIPVVGAILATILVIIGWGVTIAGLVFNILNLIKAIQYDTVQSTEIPLFGKMANAIFGKVIAKGVDFEPVEANGAAVDPNMNQQPNPNMNAQANPNMNQNAQGPVNPTQPQQPFNNPNDPTNMNQ